MARLRFPIGLSRFGDDHGFAQNPIRNIGRKMERKNTTGPAWASLLVDCAVLALGSCGGTDVGVTGDEILIGTWAFDRARLNLSTIVKAMEAYFRYV
jgi:hypothetical protein